MANHKSAVIILKKGSKILLQLRDNIPEISYPDYWGLIGGAIEENENPEEAVKREIKEEISCNVKNIIFLKKERFYNHYIKEYEYLFFFKGEIEEEAEAIKLTEGQKVEYFDFNELSSLKIPDIIKNFIIANKEIIF